MPDLTRYRETDVVLTLGIEIQYWQQLSKLMLVPDSTLQDIADASRCEHGNIYSHPTASLHSIRENTGASLWTVDVCAGSPELADLLDALEGTDK